MFRRRRAKGEGRGEDATDEYRSNAPQHDARGGKGASVSYFGGGEVLSPARSGGRRYSSPAIDRPDLGAGNGITGTPVTAVSRSPTWETEELRTRTPSPPPHLTDGHQPPPPPPPADFPPSQASSDSSTVIDERRLRPPPPHPAPQDPPASRSAPKISSNEQASSTPSTPLFGGLTSSLGKFFSPGAETEHAANDGGTDIGNDEEEEVARLLSLAVQRSKNPEKAAEMFRRVLREESSSGRRRAGGRRRATTAGDGSGDNDSHGGGTVVSARSLGGGSFDVKVVDLPQRRRQRGNKQSEDDDDHTVVSVHSVRSAPVLRAAAQSQTRPSPHLRGMHVRGSGSSSQDSRSGSSLVSTLTVDVTHDDEEERGTGERHDSGLTQKASNETSACGGKGRIIGDGGAADGATGKAGQASMRSGAMGALKSLLISPRSLPSAIPEEEKAEGESPVKSPVKEQRGEQRRSDEQGRNAKEDKTTAAAAAAQADLLAPPPLRRVAKSLPATLSPPRPSPPRRSQTARSPPPSKPSAPGPPTTEEQAAATMGPGRVVRGSVPDREVSATSAIPANGNGGAKQPLVSSSPVGAATCIVPAVRAGDNKVVSDKRPLRPELAADDFDEYFDGICPLRPKSVRVSAMVVGGGGGRGHYFWGGKKGGVRQLSYVDDHESAGYRWDTSMTGVRLSLSDYYADDAEDVVPASPAKSMKTSFKKDGSGKRAAMRTKLTWAERRDRLKARMKVMEDMAVADLCFHGFPTGLARVCHRVTLHRLPLRIWIVDNSGSMATGDGRRFQDGSKKAGSTALGRSKTSAGRVSQMVNCTRWEELRDAVVFHANLAASLRAPTIFRLLNDPNIALREDCRDDGGNLDELEILPQVVGVCARRVEPTSPLPPEALSLRNGDNNGNNGGYLGKMVRFARGEGAMDEKDVDRLAWEGVWELDSGAASLSDSDHQWRDRADKDLDCVENVLFETYPRYATPTAQHIWAINEQLKDLVPSLLPGQRVAIVIATDGLPNDPESFLDAMRQMEKLPIYIIVRLCTDDEASMHFWNCLDLDIDIPVEVLDDWEAEASAAFTMNPWCNYAMPLQRLREWGFRSPLLENLRERPLTHDELHNYCALIFGVRSSELPHPKEDWETFYYDVEALNSRESRQWNPLLKRSKKWIDMKRMAKIYGGKTEVIRQKAVEQMRKEEEKMRKEREKIRELRKKAHITREKKVLPRVALRRLQQAEQIGLGKC